MSSSSTAPHLLTLKVLRLSKPSFSFKSEIKATENLLKSSVKHELEFVSDLGMTDILELPPAFGNIYLGERFTSYLSINNDSLTAVNDVAFKAELQTTSQRFTLVDTIGATPTSSMEALNSPQQSQVSLLPRQSVEFLFDHEIKELGIHILVCSAHYTPATNSASTATHQSVDQQSRKFFRKFFKFQVLNPLSVKTKVNNLANGKICLEIQVQNLASVPLCLDPLRFEANEVFTSQDLNDHQDFSSKILSPQDVRQYLFVLSPTASNNLACKTTPNLGRLDINWKSTLGQSGHLQTSQLTRKVPSINPFDIMVLERPGQIFVERPFSMKLRIRNNLSGERQRLSVKGVKSKMANILLSGSNDLDIGVLEGQSHYDFEMEFFPIATGLHPILGIQVSEKISGLTTDLDNLAIIRVLAPVA